MLRFRRRLLAVIGFALGLIGCEADVRDETLSEPSQKRRYRLVMRKDHDAKRPATVLFALHGHATPPEVLVDGYSLIRRAVSARDWVLVVPEGERDAEGHVFWNASAACCGAGPNYPDDVAFLEAVLRDVAARYAVDAARVYALGVSNGGFLAHRWACTAGSSVRALVSVAGAGQGPDDPPCMPSRAVRVLQVHGMADEIIQFEGGKGTRGRYPSARDTAEAWAKRNGAPESDARTARLFLDTARISEWQRVASSEGRVELWAVEDGDHFLRGLRFQADELLDFLDGA